MLDGLSNTNPDPIITVDIHIGTGIYLLNAVDYGSENKTVDYSSEQVSNFIDEIRVIQ